MRARDVVALGAIGAATFVGAGALGSMVLEPVPVFETIPPATTIAVEVQPFGVTCHDHLKRLGLLHDVGLDVEQADAKVIDPATGSVSRSVCPWATEDE